MEVALQLHLPAQRDAPASARRALAGLTSYLPSEPFASAELLISELVTNSVRHAGLSSADWVEVHIRADGRTLHVEVADPGAGFDVQIRQPATGATGGYGLFLVSALASRWGVRQEGTTAVWFELCMG